MSSMLSLEKESWMNSVEVIKAKEMHQAIIYDNWKKLFGWEDFGSIDFYFDKIYNKENSYVLLEGGQLVASCQVHPHKMVLHEKIIDTSMIVGAFANTEDSLKYLMNRVLLEREKLELLTLTGDKNLEWLGFEPAYYHDVYTISRAMVPIMDSGGVRLSVSNPDLLELYRYYTKYFNGYFVRDESYYEWMKQKLKAQNGHYVGIYDAQQDLRASIRLVGQNGSARIEELIYKDTLSVLKLLSFVLSQYPLVEVSVTLVEDLSKIVKESIVKRRIALYGKLNNPALFERLYHVKVKTVDSALNAFSRPLFNNEIY